MASKSYEQQSYTARTSGQRTDPSLLNLGCGEDYREGWHNVDVSAEVDPDEVVDLNERPWPWDTNEFARIEARHVLEHLSTVPWDELKRILKPRGWLQVIYPIGHTRHEDPTHEQVWNWHTAEALSGERVHQHEHVDGLSLQERTVEWHLSINSLLLQAWIRWRLRRDGPGAWLGQVPGLYGEVRAEYQLEGDQ